MLPDSRECRKCGTDKPLSEFSKAPRGKYGRKASCKACDSLRSAASFKSRALPPEVLKLRAEERRGSAKKCTRCGAVKDRTAFNKNREGKYGPILHAHCKECQSAAARQWFAENKERAKENRHRWNLANFYGITPEQYLAMLDEQGGVCAICGHDEPNEHGRTGTKFRLSVDHCHETGRVRGLLCQKCNRAIGLLNDNTDLLRKAIGYLERE